MNTLQNKVQYIKGVGEKKAKLFEKLGIYTIEDLISYFPRSYDDRRIVYDVSNAPLDVPVCTSLIVASDPIATTIRRSLELLKFRAVDSTCSVDITFFNQNYLKNTFSVGNTFLFYGKLSKTGSKYFLTNPEFEKEESSGVITNCIVPIYRLTSGISQKALISAIKNALILCENDFPSYIPESISRKHKFCQAKFAYYNIHFPNNDACLQQARERLAFEELFVLSSALSLIKNQRVKKNGRVYHIPNLSLFFNSLPFTPTNAQIKAIQEASKDMISGKSMNRLLQGDVGSGKTLVAAALIWICVLNHQQAAFMAPTEILAEQHFHTLKDFLEPFGIKIIKLTGSMKAKEKKDALEALSSGEASLAIGTHALIGKDVKFSDLGLVITDEQHRFGVNQRGLLGEKGINPHVLVMSATPIPRTLSLIIFGDLEISILDELPPGRQAVETYVVNESMRPRIYKFVERLVEEGRQVFIVCPMIEENDTISDNLKDVEKYSEQLKISFPSLKICCIHGKMKSKDKESLMSQFASGEYDILVSTTVIEVGVDIPNAALMIIENAERFGLSQLHQLRGRVGRGNHKSYCILFSESENELAKNRLSILSKTNDGFKLSEEDLKLRGPGDFFGQRQHGLPDMHVADLSGDIQTLKSAQEESESLIKNDPLLIELENQSLKQRIYQLYTLYSEQMN